MGMHRPVISIALLLAFSTVSNARHIVQTSQNTRRSALPAPGVCFTPACRTAADQILHYMDKEVDPCDNFYQFACGGFLKYAADIFEGIPRVNALDFAQAEVNQKLLELLKKEPEISDPPYAEMLKNMYNSCMDEETIEREGADPLKRMLRQLGGWPVVEGRGWDESRFDWVDNAIAMDRLGYSPDIIFDLSITRDSRNNKVHILGLNQASLGMPDRSYLLNGLSDPHTEAYYQMMVDAAKLLGVEETTAKRELLGALNFEMALANYSMAKQDRRDINKLYNKYTIGELQNMAPQVPWLKYFNGLLNGEVDEEEPVVVDNPTFIVNVAELINATEKRVIANYMMWRVVRASMDMLSEEWQDISKMYDDLFGFHSGLRIYSCLGSVTGYLGIALSSYYVKNYFKEESKEAVSVIVEYVQQEFLKILNRVDWMDEDTRREAIEKAKAIQSHIGYPAELVDDAAIMKYYENLTITSESYFDNIMSVNRWSKDGALSRLRKPVVKGNWITHSKVIKVNAYYFALENSIGLTAAILQNEFFDINHPNYMNFGGIGFVIGHEITHGFDDKGRKFDKDGNNVNWWDKDTDEHFIQKTQCIIDQYGNYTVEDGLKLNGVYTQGENIADNGGLKEAYWAYRSWVKDNGAEKTLPGLNYTQNQLFWISAANAWCSRYRPEYLKMLIITDSHSPSEYRIIGPMSNLQEFSTDFNCPLGSPMNKPHKCQVW